MSKLQCWTVAKRCGVMLDGSFIELWGAGDRGGPSRMREGVTNGLETELGHQGQAD